MAMTKKHSCKYNDGVECNFAEFDDAPQCDSCGWNPKAAITREMNTGVKRCPTCGQLLPENQK